MAPNSSISPNARSAFTLVEILVSITLMASVATGVFQLYTIFWKGRAPSHIVNTATNSECETCPSQSSMYKGVILNRALCDALDSASEIYVFGGRGQSPTDAEMALDQTTRPLADASTDALLGADLRSAVPSYARLDPRAMAAGLVSNGLASLADENTEGNYSVVMLAGAGIVSGTLQVHTSHQTDAKGTMWTLWWVKLITEGKTYEYSAAMDSRWENFTEVPKAITAWTGNPDAEPNTGRFRSPVYRFVLPDPSLESGSSLNPRPLFNHVYRASR